MKRLDTSSISASAEMPVKSGTLEFLQDSWKEGLAGVLSSLIESPQAGTMYVLSGCVNSTVAPIHTISAGVLYYDGEIYQSDAATFTLTGGQKAYAGIDITQFVINADPVEFTDGVNRNVHNIRKIVIAAATVGSGLPEFKDFVTVSRFFTGETKNIVMSSGDYAAKFVQSGGTAGLGKFEFTGWAVMNGNNGTEDDDGLVEVAYGASRTTLEATLGEATHTLVEAEIPAHTHTEFGFAVGAVGVLGGTTYNFGVKDTGSYGGGGAHNNMQPSRVRLRIQKI